MSRADDQSSSAAQEREPASALPQREPASALRWYAAGLRFECTRCGRCCTGAAGYVWVDVGEIETLARHFGLSLDDFGRRFLRRVNGRYALLERAASGDCVFYDAGSCSVYQARPRQCRAFPFWPRNLASPAAWAAAARDCEGIRDDAPLISSESIAALGATRGNGG